MAPKSEQPLHVHAQLEQLSAACEEQTKLMNQLKDRLVPVCIPEMAGKEVGERPSHNVPIAEELSRRVDCIVFHNAMVNDLIGRLQV